MRAHPPGRTQLTSLEAVTVCGWRRVERLLDIAHCKGQPQTDWVELGSMDWPPDWTVGVPG